MNTTTTENKQVTRAAVYTRISRDKSGERLGVQRQLESCRALAVQLGWEIDASHIYSDDDLSAFTGRKRPGFENMLAALRAGEIAGLLCWHPDRLYRRLDDLVRLFEAAPGVEIRSVNGGALDLSNASGKMLATILGGVASYESEHKIERQLAAARQKAEKGKPQWKRAFGYLPDTRDKRDDDGTRQIDPKTGPLVVQAYAALLAGSTLMDICQLFNDAQAFGMNGKPWTPTTVSLFMRSPRNAGLREYRGELVYGKDGKPVKGTWPPLVPVSTWRAAQADVLNAPDRKKPGRKSVRRHPLTSVMRCGKPGCGGYLAGNWVMTKTGGQPGRPKAGEPKPTHDGQVKHSITYSCRKCHGVAVRAEHAEPLLRKLVGGRLALPDAENLLKAEGLDDAEAEALRVESTSLYAQIAAAEAEYDDGIIDGRRLAARVERVNDKLAVIRRKEHDAERVRVLDGIPLGRPAAVAAVAALSDDRFRAVLGLLCEITVAPVGKGGKRFDRKRVQVRWHHPVHGDIAA